MTFKEFWYSEGNTARKNGKNLYEDFRFVWSMAKLEAQKEILKEKQEKN